MFEKIETSKIYRNILYSEFKKIESSNKKTIIDVFEESCSLYDKDKFLGKIVLKDKFKMLETDTPKTLDMYKIDYISHKTSLSTVKKLSCFIRKLGLQRKIISIFSKNRAEWILADQAILRSNNICLPIYATFGLPAMEHVLNETESTVMFISLESYSLLRKVLSNESVKIRDLIFFDRIPKKEQEYLKSLNINHHSFESIIKQDNQKFSEVLPSLDDIATICYTSGTTSLPKGVVITHRNIMSVVLSYELSRKNKQFFSFDENDVYLSYLPLPHVLERQLVFSLINFGTEVVFYRGDRKLFIEDFKIAKPTFMSAVPRIFEIIRDKTLSKIDNFYKSFFFELGTFIKKYFSFGSYKNIVFDKLLFSKIKEQFGGRVRAIVVGSTQCDIKLIEFMQVAFSCPVYQGYGMTETTASALLTTIDNNVTGTVGVPFPNTEIKLVKYKKHNIYQIYLRGTNIFREYYRNSILNDQFFENGWFKTGDSCIVENDNFKIMGRINNTFKTSQGEFIVPEKIESYYKNVVDDILVIGNTFKNYIIAIIVYKNKNFSYEQVKEKLFLWGQKLKEDHKLSSFEIPKDFIVIRDDFSDIKGLVTDTTLKLIRKNVNEYFKTQIDLLFSN